MLAKCLNSTRTLASTIFGIFEPKGRWGGVKNYIFLAPLGSRRGRGPQKGRLSHWDCRDRPREDRVSIAYAVPEKIDL